MKLILFLMLLLLLCSASARRRRLCLLFASFSRLIGRDGERVFSSDATRSIDADGGNVLCSSLFALLRVERKLTQFHYIQCETQEVSVNRTFCFLYTRNIKEEIVLV